MKTIEWIAKIAYYGAVNVIAEVPTRTDPVAIVGRFFR